MPTGKFVISRTSGDSISFSMSSREQLAVAKFAQCLQVIPKTLAINAALDAADLVSKVSFLSTVQSTVLINDVQ